jgi:hypothetical protein
VGCLYEAGSEAIPCAVLVERQEIDGFRLSR